MRKGFTLIELICVISIISILAGTILPVVGEIMDQVRDARAATETKHLGLAFVQYENKYGYLPGSNRGGRTSYSYTSSSAMNTLNNEMSLFLSKRLINDPFGIHYRVWINLGHYNATQSARGVCLSAGRNRTWNNWNSTAWLRRSIPINASDDDHVYIFK
jgi:prepilin-type N-terminal cleavage/methylation domain-containing protein